MSTDHQWSRVELALGTPLGVVPEALGLPSSDSSPREELERIIDAEFASGRQRVRLLLRWSRLQRRAGARGSLARRRGAPMPVPVTLRFAESSGERRVAVAGPGRRPSRVDGVDRDRPTRRRPPRPGDHRSAVDSRAVLPIADRQLHPDRRCRDRRCGADRRGWRRVVRRLAVPCGDAPAGLGAGDRGEGGGGRGVDSWTFCGQALVSAAWPVADLADRRREGCGRRGARRCRRNRADRLAQLSGVVVRPACLASRPAHPRPRRRTVAVSRRASPGRARRC